MWHRIFGLFSVSLVLLFFFINVVPNCVAQYNRKIQGDLKESRISQVSGIEDVRDDQEYRRPPTYKIIFSHIVRPSTIYQVVVSLLEEAKPMRVRAALSRDGVEVYGDHVNLNPKEKGTILLQVPPGNNIDSVYRYINNFRFRSTAST